MSNSGLDQVEALLRQLGDPGTGATAQVARLIVATDWSKAAVPLSLLQSFRAIVPPSAPLRLVFALPHEPTERDAECVAVLTEGVDGESNTRGLDVESFDAAGATGYDCAVVPTGDQEYLITQVAGMVTRMHYLMRRYEEIRARAGDVSVIAGNQGSVGELRERLAGFTAS